MIKAWRIWGMAALWAAAAMAQQPVVTALLNNYSYLLPNTPNYAFARGSIVQIYGTNLGPATGAAGNLNPVLQKSLSGTSVRFTVGVTSTEGVLYYVSATQINAILPSATPAGAGTVTVTYNGATSATFPIQVVQSAFGLLTMGGNGLGQAVVQDANYTYLTPTNTAKEDQTVILWGTGLGPDSNDETRLIGAPQSLNSLPFELYIGHKPAEVLYHGRSQFPGLDQIVAKIPRGVNGCYVSAYVKTGPYLSNFTTIPVSTGTACGEFFATPEELISWSTKPNITAGWLYLGKFISHIPGFSAQGVTIPASTSVTNAANAQFLSSNPFNYLNYGAISQPSYGNCVTAVISYTNPFQAPIVKVLDPGAVSLTLPDGALRNLTKTPNSWVLSGGGGQMPLFIPDAGGTFTFKGAGGLDVGVFSSPITVTNQLVWTNRAAISTVNRNQNLEITWMGGDPASYVVLNGATTNLTNAVTTFSCLEKASAGRLTVPRDVLAAMLVSVPSPGAPIPTGQLILFNYTQPKKFTASGIDNGNISYYTGETILVNYQ